MPDQPLVSVLMNCYNGERYLRAAIDSVIGQTYRNWELIFWDNQSSDSSADICRNYADERVRYFQADQHTSLGAARALALSQARGEFVAVLDTDDLWMPHKLEKQVPRFSDPAVGIVISDTIFFSDNGKERRLYGRRPPPQGWVFQDLLANYFVSLETVVMRRSAIESLAHDFDATFSHISDFDLIVRLSSSWKLVCVEEVLAKWRVHPGSATWTEPDRFFREKLEFVRKMDVLPEFEAEWRKCRKAFVTNTIVSGAILSLSSGDRSLCREMLGRYVLSSWKACLVYVLAWLPLSIGLVRAYRRRKALA